MKTILILMDTLNRHMLKTYCPDAEAVTPNIDRLARRCMIFDNLCDKNAKKYFDFCIEYCII